MRLRFSDFTKFTDTNNNRMVKQCNAHAILRVNQNQKYQKLYVKSNKNTLIHFSAKWEKRAFIAHVGTLKMLPWSPKTGGIGIKFEPILSYSGVQVTIDFFFSDNVSRQFLYSCGYCVKSSWDSQSSNILAQVFRCLFFVSLFFFKSGWNTDGISMAWITSWV